jgi:hypothetical protein
MTRRLVLIPVLLAIWTSLCAWAAGVPWNAPLTSRESLSLGGRDFHVRFGKGDNEPSGLVVQALGEDGTGLQTARVARLPAKDYPILRYRVADFPDMLELALVFRRSDAPDDVQTISLPAPGRGEVAVDLSRFAEWHGEITELGFAEYATAQLVPPSVAASFKSFRIEQAQLQGPAWDVVFSRLRSDWFGYRPWALLSISTIGPGLEVLGQSWMLPALAIGAFASWLAAWLILRWPRARALRMACVMAGSAWILLDLRWLDDLFAKHRITEEMYAGKPWVERRALQPDEATYAAAGEITRIAADAGVERVLVDSGSTYTLLRLSYFLLPLNVAPLHQAMDAASRNPLPGRSLIALLGSDMKYDEATGRLGDGENAIPAKQVYAQGDLRVFRPGGASP